MNVNSSAKSNVNGQINTSFNQLLEIGCCLLSCRVLLEIKNGWTYVRVNGDSIDTNYNTKVSFHVIFEIVPVINFLQTICLHVTTNIFVWCVWCQQLFLVSSFQMWKLFLSTNNTFWNRAWLTQKPIVINHNVISIFALVLVKFCIL